MIDFRDEFDALYTAQERVVARVETEYTGYLMIDGRGEANNNKAFAQAIEVLLGLSQSIKHAIKNGPLGVEYSVMPLEAQWWIDDDPRRRKQSKYCWTLMVMQPEYVSGVLVEHAIEQAKRKKKLPIYDRVRFEYREETCAIQTMGRGVFDQRGPATQLISRYLDACKIEGHGARHEVYLNDPRRGGFDKWKTILRLPVVSFGDIEPPLEFTSPPEPEPAEVRERAPAAHAEVQARTDVDSEVITEPSQEGEVVVDLAPAPPKRRAPRKPQQRSPRKPRAKAAAPAATDSPAEQGADSATEKSAAEKPTAEKQEGEA